MRHHEFFAGYVIGVLCAVGCASSPIFPYHYYAPEMPTTCYDQGTLLGKSGDGGWADETLDECKPDPDPSPSSSVQPVKLRCIITKADDFYDLKAKYMQCQNDLQICQAGPAPK